MVSLCSPGTHCVARAGVELRNPSAAASWVSGLEARVVITQPQMGFSLSSELLHIIRLFVNYIRFPEYNHTSYSPLGAQKWNQKFHSQSDFNSPSISLRWIPTFLICFSFSWGWKPVEFPGYPCSGVIFRSIKSVYCLLCDSSCIWACCERYTGTIGQYLTVDSCQPLIRVFLWPSLFSFSLSTAR